jgi:hypothetical protein
MEDGTPGETIISWCRFSCLRIVVMGGGHKAGNSIVYRMKILHLHDQAATGRCCISRCIAP